VCPRGQNGDGREVPEALLIAPRLGDRCELAVEPAGAPASPPGECFRRDVLAAMPDIEAMELVERFFAIGAKGEREAAEPLAGPSGRRFERRCSRGPAGAVRPAGCGVGSTSTT